MTEFPQSIKINRENSGSRLDKFLTKEFPSFSRSQWQKRIEEGLVLVNGAKATVHRWLKENDAVGLDWEKIGAAEKPLTDALEPDADIKLNIIYEDGDFLVVSKPAGLVVHPSATRRKGTLVNALLAHYPAIRDIGEDELRPGIVHRLDKYASGLMVVAKTQAAFEHLKGQFKNRLIDKEYVALAKGKIPQAAGTIDLPISRGDKIPAKMTVRTAPPGWDKTGKARAALTEYEVMNYHNSGTLVRVRIKTGRTHQIRVHFSALGYPLVGDAIYKPRKMKLSEAEKGLGRIFLHASRLGFSDSSGNWREFKADLPDELQNYLSKLQ